MSAPGQRPEPHPHTATPVPASRGRRRRGWLRKLAGLVLLAWIGSGLWHANKPLPEGVSASWPVRPAQDVALLADLTWTDARGRRHSEQAIFDAMLQMIGQARRLIVADLFLFNDFGAGAGGQAHHPLSAELTAALTTRLRQVPGLQVVLVTDPVNTVYGGVTSPYLDALEQAGATVVMTRLAALRAPNPGWSGLWHLCCRWLGNDADGGWLPNPLGPGKVTLRSWLALINLHANHRKTLLVDTGDGWAGLVTSANPHDASSAHGNVALRFSGGAVLDLLASELAVLEFSGHQALASTLRERLTDEPGDEADATVAGTGPEPQARVQLLLESRIRDALLERIEASAAGDRLDIAVFYLSHRRLIAALIRAHRRGVQVRVLLDPNEDAFGRKKNGVPNRQVAWELHRAGVPVRWCDTHGEQCHAKLLLYRGAGERDAATAELVLGSANFTRRNLDGYNLETNVRLLAGAGHDAIVAAADLFERSWHNEPDRYYSVDYSAYHDPSRLRRWHYRIGEATGLSSW